MRRGAGQLLSATAEYHPRVQQRVPQPDCEDDTRAHPVEEAWHMLAGKQLVTPRRANGASPLGRASSALDRGVVTGETLGPLGAALDAAGWRARLATSGRAGVTEIVSQPAGPDIERELATFAAMAGL